MEINFSQFINKKEVIAVGLSGGSDSMALLNYLLDNQKKYRYSVIAINVEHGIRGEESLKDTEFVKEYCKKKGVPLYCYTVDAVSYSKENGLSVEEGARALRYKCFYDAIEKGDCDKVATAHHLSDNFESVLFNLFRGTGIKGLTGINEKYGDKIIRPFLNVSKDEILYYIKRNNIPFVSDSTNFCDDYSRNNLRLNVVPKIKDAFPSAEKSVMRLTSILKEYDEFVNAETEKHLKYFTDKVELSLPCENLLISNATIIAMKYLGVEKDWEMAHAQQVVSLSANENGARVNLPKNVVAIKEYDKICFYKDKPIEELSLPFCESTFYYVGKKYSIKKVPMPSDLKKGFYADFNKIPKDAVIRTKKDGDVFIKFGGGSKKLNDYFTDIKIPLKDRDTIPVIAKGNIIYFIFGIAISDLIKVDESTKSIVQFII